MLKRLIFVLMAALAMVGVAEAKKKPKPVQNVPVTAVVPAVTPEDTLVLVLSTGGTVRIQLRPDKAPNHVERIKLLARAGFYDGLLFHRVIEGFMAQTGDPKATGEGGSPLPDLKAEFNDMPHLRGTMSLARAESNDSANSQFFIGFLPSMKLDGKYTPVGRVISGMQFVDLIERGEPPAAPSRMVKAYIESDGEGAARVALVVPVAAPAPVPAPAAPVETPPTP